MVYQPVQQIDIPALFATMAQLRAAKLNQQQGELQLADLYEARDRRHQIQAALDAGDLDAYARLDPMGYAKLQQQGLETTKTKAEIADKQSQTKERERAAIKDVDENTTKVQQFVSKAIEANPASAPQWQQHVDNLAAAGKINHFTLPGFQQSPELAGPSMQPNAQEIRTMQAGAGVEDPYGKPTAPEIQFARIHPEMKPGDPGYGPALERFIIGLQQAGSGQAPVILTQNLRKEFDALPEVRNYNVVRSALANIKSASANGVGDLSTIFAYMKLLDPNSSVREGETAAASNAGGVPESIRALWNKALGQGSLTAPLRKQFVAEATRIEQQQRKFYDRAANQFKRMAATNGLNPNDVVINLDEHDPEAPGVGNANTHVIGFEGPGSSPQDIEFNPNPGQSQPARQPQAPQRRGPPVTRAQALSEFDQLMGLGR